MFYVIKDKKDEGFVQSNPIEGWIFTRISNDATQFVSHELAQKTIEQHYKGCDLEILEKGNFK